MNIADNEVGEVGYKMYNDGPEIFDKPKGVVLHCSINQQFSEQLTHEQQLDMLDRKMKTLFNMSPNKLFLHPFNHADGIL